MCVYNFPIQYTSNLLRSRVNEISTYIMLSEPQQFSGKVTFSRS